MKKIRPLCMAAALLGLSSLVLFTATSGQAQQNSVKHVLLISVDGMHALDLAKYVKLHPSSTLSALTGNGVTYTNASCSKPSDSFPGLLALVTGGSPISTGVWYDDSYDRLLLPPGGSPGSTPAGTEVVYDESIDWDNTALDGGASQHSGQPINPDALPVDPTSGAKVYPHQFLRANTIFEVARRAGMHTAWTDKHPAYELVNGPSGKGVGDLFTPEIAAPIHVTGQASPVVPADALQAIEAYDDVKVQSIVNEIDGYDHTRASRVGVPAVFGMNFQTVSVGQKLKTDAIDGRTGGYLDAGGTPTPLLSDALDYVDSRLKTMVDELRTNHLLSSTLIVVTAKHGQAPIGVNNLQKLGHAVGGVAGGRAAQVTDDDVALVWLKRQTDTSAVAADLESANGFATDPATNFSAQQTQPIGINDILWGDSLKLKYNDPATDSRTPDLIVVPKEGVIYTHSGAKNAEHGGFNSQDTNVLLVLSNPSWFPSATTIKSPVQTTQVAPTILAALHLDPSRLDAVRTEHTPVLPGLTVRGALSN